MKIIAVVIAFSLIAIGSLMIANKNEPAKKPKDLPYVCTSEQREAGECL